MPIVGDCGVCNLTKAKYKCPACVIVYCSVACYKSHKEQEKCNEVATKDQEQEKSKTVTSENLTDNEYLDEELKYEFETEDTVPPEKLQLLDQDPVILQLLKNKHLRELMLKVDSSQNPYEAVANAIKDPIFEEFATQCLNIVEDRASDDESDDSM